MSAVDTDVLEELGELIEDLTTTGQPSLDDVQLKRLKSICKSSNSYVNHAFHLVLTQLKKFHAEIRLSAFQIIVELFKRSHVFRDLLLSDFQVFLELVVASDAQKPLPPPTSTAKILKTKAVDAIEGWYQTYGSHYKKLELGYLYLKRLKHVEFDAVHSTTLVEQRHAQEREQRKQRILQKKIDKVENEMAEQLGHIELCLTEINNCFKLLLPHPEDYDLSGNSKRSVQKGLSKVSCTTTTPEEVDKNDDTNLTNKDSDEFLEAKENSIDKLDSFSVDTEGDLKDHGMSSTSFEINIDIGELRPSVNETEDNSIVVETTRELNKEITQTYIPMVTNWLGVFTKAGYNQQRIQSVIDLKNQLMSSKEKFSELNISLIKINMNADDSDESDDALIDVPEKEGIEFIPTEKRAEYGLESLDTPTIVQSDESFLDQHGFTLKDAEDPTSQARALLEARKKFSDKSKAILQQRPKFVPVASCSKTTEVDDKRKQLLEKAPVIKFGMDLYHWDDPNYEPPKLIRSHNFNNFWASKDADTEHFFEDAKSSMVKRNISFSGKFVPVKWSCRAALPNGKLCPRKDRYKCPFHGIIVARDEKGNPSGKSLEISSSLPSASSSETWQDIQQDVEAATGIDLNPRGKKRKARKTENPNKKLSRKQKYARLTDLNKSSKTPKSRLEMKVLDEKAMKRVAAKMDSMASKRVLDKFGDQFNYQYLVD